MRAMTAAGRSRWATPLRVALVVILALILLVPAGGTAAAHGDTDRAKVFVYWTPKASECDNLNRVPKWVRTPRVATRALRRLLAGPTKADRQAGITSYLFSSKTAGMLRSVSIRHGVAHVDFKDLRPVLPKARTSCGRTSLLAQLNATTMQFSSVHSARYSIDGSERTFYRWLGMTVPGRSRVVARHGSLHNTRAIRGSSTRRPRLSKIRVGRHARFDRVVFQFVGGRPSYAVSYAAVPRSGGSGAPIPFGGTAALQIDMGARTFIDTEGFPLLFTPTAPFKPRLPTLRTVRYGGEFEALATFGASVKARTGFRVLEMANPPRLVIDDAHGAKVRTLRRGLRGPDARDWRRQLNTVQFGPFAVSRSPHQGRLTNGSVFDGHTVRATRVFQRAEGVDVDGVVRSSSRDAMRRAIWRASKVTP